MTSTRRVSLCGLLGAALLSGCPGDPVAMIDAGGAGTDTGPATDAPAAADTGSIDAPLVGAGPVADIFHPSTGEDRRVSMVVPMIGDANDAEDGALADAVMLWSSDVEGAIGTGRMFDWTPTMTGAQVITLTATDSDGQIGTESITLNIIP